MRRVHFLFCSLLMLFSASFLLTGRQAFRFTVFEGGRLILGDGTAPIERGAFVVENGRFTSVGRSGEVQVPRGAARIDFTGKTIIPAMIDVHSHFGFLDQKNGAMSKENFNPENLL